MPWLTTDQMRDAVADVLREAGGGSSLPDAWSSVIDAATADAAADIRAALGSLGYSSSQIDRWDRLAVYHRSIALYRAFTDGGILIDFPQDRIDRLDRRKELSRKADPPFMFTAAGVPEAPSATLAGDPVGGRVIASGTITSVGTRITDDTTY